jgi:hypothetical protein
VASCLVINAWRYRVRFLFKVEVPDWLKGARSEFGAEHFTRAHALSLSQVDAISRGTPDRTNSRGLPESRNVKRI